MPRARAFGARVTWCHTFKQGVARACAFGHCNVIQWLLQEYPGQHLEDDALWCAAYSGRLDVLQWLVASGKVTVAAPLGRMAMKAACIRGDRPTAVGLFALDPRPEAWPPECVASVRQWMRWSKPRVAWMRACVNRCLGAG